jgi:LacI family transcriptional regulator
MIASAFGELVGGTAQAAWEAGADLSLAFIHRPEALAAWLDRARAERTVDGLLVRAAGDVTPDELLLLERTGLPYVLVKRHVPGHAAPCVVADERRAVRLATEHLLALGHRRIGFVASQQSAVLYAERLQGFRDALAGAGLAPAGRLLAPAPDFSAESGRTSAAALLRAPARSRPTALMVASDSMAIGAYEAAAARGLAIPAELSIASVDDIPEARALRPALTTARTSHLEFGLRATRRVLAAVAARWRGDPVPAGAEVIVPELIVRNSTAPPPTSRAAPGLAALTGSKTTGRRRTP